MPSSAQILLKVLLFLLLLHLLCLPHVAEQQKFRFDVILEGMGRASPVVSATALPEDIATHEVGFLLKGFDSMHWLMQHRRRHVLRDDA